MTKREFFDLCNRAECHLHQLGLTVRRVDLDNVIELTGSTWCNQGLVSLELYRPLPGRQGRTDHGVYAVANARIAKKIVVFKRWLAEWKRLNNVKEPSNA